MWRGISRNVGDRSQHPLVELMSGYRRAQVNQTSLSRRVGRMVEGKGRPVSITADYQPACWRGVSPAGASSITAR